MSKGFQIEIKGAKDWYKLLDGLPLQLKANALKSVHRKALTEKIKKNLPQKYQKAFKLGNDRGDKTGVLGGFKPENFKLRFVEYGVKMRQTKKGVSRGSHRADPFLNPVIDAEAQGMVQYINDNYGVLLQSFIQRKVKAINRAAKK